MDPSHRVRGSHRARQLFKAFGVPCAPGKDWGYMSAIESTRYPPKGDIPTLKPGRAGYFLPAYRSRWQGVQLELTLKTNGWQAKNLFAATASPANLLVTFYARLVHIERLSLTGPAPATGIASPRCHRTETKQQTKKGVKLIQLNPFVCFLVAGTGFEPVTFGL